MLIGISPIVALSEGKESTFYTTLLTAAAETHLKKNFRFIQNFCLILMMLVWFEKLPMIPCIMSIVLFGNQGQFKR